MDSSSPASLSSPQPAPTPETTPRALALGIVLALVMAAANAYLGLYAGMTVSASIPAAVVSMAVLRGLLRRGTILENNIVQTMASAGESLAAGIVFTVPALVLIGAWDDFRFVPTTLVALLGGTLGVVLMVPMRRALIVQRPDLTYPEGVACAEVLKAGQAGGEGASSIALGAVVGAGFKFLSAGIAAVRGTVEWAWAKAGSLWYVGADLSPALLGVGYIVGLPVAVLISLGGLVAWGVVLPAIGQGVTGNDPLSLATGLWKAQIRYVGIGAMVVGGVHSVWSVRRGLAAGILSLRRPRGLGPAVPRTERDMRLSALLAILAAATLGTLAFYQWILREPWMALLMTGVMVLAAFLFVAVATFIAGLVGSSNSPVSGMTICALLMACVVLLALGWSGLPAMVAALAVAGVVCCATCTAGDVAQDLKTGLLVGATPARQQWVEILGVVIPALVFAPSLSLLHRAYGIGTGQPGSLRAPQAVLFASLVQGFFGGESLPWRMMALGAGVGALILCLNAVLAALGVRFRAHLMPVAVGMYLPVSLDVPILLGGILHHLTRSRVPEASGGGVLCASGLIAGEALMGIVLAVPMCVAPHLLPSVGGGPVGSVVVFLAVVAMLATVAVRRPKP